MKYLAHIILLHTLKILAAIQIKFKNKDNMILSGTTVEILMIVLYSMLPLKLKFTMSLE